MDTSNKIPAPSNDSYLFSKANNAFYPLSMKADYEASNTWPGDGIIVDAAVFMEFTAQAPEGKMRGSNKKGEPSWVDVPPLTKEESIAQANGIKNTLRSAADSEIAPLQDAVDLGIATDNESQRLMEWKKYRVLLNRIDTTMTPDIIWPDIPE